MRTDVGSRKPCRILIVGPSPPPFNGMSVVTQALLEQLAKHVDLIHLDTADRRDISNVGRLDVVNLLLAMVHGAKYLYMLLIKRPDVVYVPIAQAWLPYLRDCLFLVPARCLGKPVVVHLHGGHFQAFYASCNAVMKWIIRVTLGRTQRAIVLGRSLEGAFDGVIARERVRVVPNGVADLVQVAGRKKSEGQPFTVVYLSLLIREKGVFDLLQAASIVVQEGIDCQFVFAGEWYRPEEIREADEVVNSLGIRKHVKFVGSVGPEGKRELLTSADIFALPTYYPYEGQPCAILEAMSAGLPIITTDAGCIAETVIDNHNGYLVSAKNPAAIADRLLLLWKDSELRQRMGGRSRKRYAECYTLGEFADRVAEVLNESVGKTSVFARPQESRSSQTTSECPRS